MMTDLDGKIFLSSGQDRYQASYSHALSDGLTLHVAAITDKGCARDKNEDNFLLYGPMLVVADGAGGGAFGERASEITTRGLLLYCLRNQERAIRAEVEKMERFLFEKFGADHAAKGKAELMKLLYGLLEGNYDLRDACISQKGSIATMLDALNGKMGTTIVVANLGAAVRHIEYYHHGDSQLRYVPENNHLLTLTPEDTVSADFAAALIEQGLEPLVPQWTKGVLTSGLGGGSECIKRERLVQQTPLQKGTYLLHSDGLTLVEPELMEIVRYTSVGKNPLGRTNDTAEALVQAALRNGSRDNITVIVGRVE